MADEEFGRRRRLQTLGEPLTHPVQLFISSSVRADSAGTAILRATGRIPRSSLSTWLVVSSQVQLT